MLSLLKALTRKNFDRVIILTRYTYDKENEKALKELAKQDDNNVLIVSLNGYRTQLADCIMHTDYNTRKINRTNLKEYNLPLLTFRDYTDSMSSNIVDCREFKFFGSTLLTAVNFFIEGHIKNILLYMDNTAHSDMFIWEQREGINNFKDYRPKCKIYQITNGNFDLDVITVKDFVSGLHS